MKHSTRTRLTIDEINTDRDGREIATLVEPGGGIVTMPLSVLPHGARVNQVIVAEFRIDTASTCKRVRRIRELQHRLFSRDSESR